MSDHIGLGLLVTVLGWAILIVGIILGNARVVGIGAGTIFLSDYL